MRLKRYSETVGKQMRKLFPASEEKQDKFVRPGPKITKSLAGLCLRNARKVGKAAGILK